ncbi:MAG TPA: phosphatidylglycerophosphatase A [Candidatus Acidoferrales bacterium]|nr:phosphatidylglycerophosphatase A [Candidatus Acidoferrales bacterium]
MVKQMAAETESGSAQPPRKPRLSLFFATACGVGYIPKAPGTWGSLVGVAIYCMLISIPTRIALDFYLHGVDYVIYGWPVVPIVALVLALFGVVTASRVAKSTGKKDPQFVVIDEVSGQSLAYFLALVPLNWKYLALGFILFRLFDIWKPFPARQAESLSGGWGIMADDWVAGIYAAIGIWIARILGL